MKKEEKTTVTVEKQAILINVDGENITVLEALRRIKAKDKKKRRLSEG